MAAHSWNKHDVFEQGLSFLCSPVQLVVCLATLF